MSYLKVMLCSPMVGKTGEEIADERLDMMNKIEAFYPDSEYEIIDMIISDYESIECLVEPVKFLGQADVLVMGKAWNYVRNCSLLHNIAASYGLPIRYL